MADDQSIVGLHTLVSLWQGTRHSHYGVDDSTSAHPTSVGLLVNGVEIVTFLCDGSGELISDVFRLRVFLNGENVTEETRDSRTWKTIPQQTRKIFPSLEHAFEQAGVRCILVATGKQEESQTFLTREDTCM